MEFIRFMTLASHLRAVRTHYVGKYFACVSVRMCSNVTYERESRRPAALLQETLWLFQARVFRLAPNVKSRHHHRNKTVVKTRKTCFIKSNKNNFIIPPVNLLCADHVNNIKLLLKQSFLHNHYIGHILISHYYRSVFCTVYTTIRSY